MTEFFIGIFVMIILAIPLSDTMFESGKRELCKKQFSGEMHEGKCVSVKREEIK